MSASAVATQLVTVLSGLSGISTAQIGAPKSISPQVGAWVTIGSQSTRPKTTGYMIHEARFFVLFVYRVDDNESTAETTLMGLVDAFRAALLADLTLSGTAKSLEIDTGLADEPDYQIRAGKEYREYPVVVTATGYESFTVNP